MSDDDVTPKVRPIRPPAAAGTCRVCGCTDSRPCVLHAENDLVDVADVGETLPLGYTTCSWIEPDLCSGCVWDKAPPLLYDANGNPIGRAP